MGVSGEAEFFVEFFKIYLKASSKAGRQARQVEFREGFSLAVRKV
jgi:hypothetical protein